MLDNFSGVQQTGRFFNEQDTQGPQTIQKWKKKSAFRMERHDRTAGYMPVWGKQETAKQEVSSRLSYIDTPQESFENAMAYAANQGPYPTTTHDTLDFGDVIDVVNPLQHIPVVNMLYRGITGDEIGGVAQIIGGAIYGGPIGAVSGTINAIVKHETGKDVAGNAVSMLLGDNKQAPAEIYNNPEERLNQAITITKAAPELPGTALSFADLKANNMVQYRETDFASGRTAGKMRVMDTASSQEIKNTLPSREPITTVSLSPMTYRFND